MFLQSYLRRLSFSLAFAGSANPSKTTNGITPDVFIRDSKRRLLLCQQYPNNKQHQSKKHQKRLFHTHYFYTFVKHEIHDQ